MIINISSKQNTKIKEIGKLISDNSYRKERNEFVIEGFHLLEMALEDKLVKAIFSLEPIKNIDEKITNYIVSEDILKKISTQKNPQGVVAICSMRKEKEISHNNVLYLDGVSDPGNLGTLLRTALAFSFKDVILSKGSVSLYNEKTISSSQGAIFRLNIISGDEQNLIDLKEKGYKILATEIKGSVELKNIKKSDKQVLILGNEAHGVNEKILNLADERIRIDINEIESLNVAICGAIMMHYLR
ncbi:MAG: RNA methyltransferase [Erysipelotrichaceae bacterium]|nr:RNA methyltransferase [Erysipelotrichaceae bacterium]